jgi:tetraacyldisaccharide 4'-kinase
VTRLLRRLPKHPLPRSERPLSAKQARLEQRLTQAWQRHGLLACLLGPLGLLMWLLVGLRRRAFLKGWLKRERLPVPVVVVGNRIAGGAGKTPTTLALLQHLCERGWTPGVLSRGYGAKTRQADAPWAADTGGVATFVLLDAHTQDRLTPADTGDEPMLIWRRSACPVMVHRDRAAAGRALLAAHPDINILVCDDGLQHLKLQRDIEVVVFDERGQGNGWLLPAGPLREPISVASGSVNGQSPLVLYNADRPTTPLPGHLARRGLAPLQTLQAWQAAVPTSPDEAPPRHQALVALAGIAQPERFFTALRAQGWQIQGISLPDHADWSQLPWAPEIAHVVVTEKDAVKIDLAQAHAQRPATTIWVAALHFQPEPDFWMALDAQLPSPPPATQP